MNNGKKKFISFGNECGSQLSNTIVYTRVTSNLAACAVFVVLILRCPLGHYAEVQGSFFKSILKQTSESQKYIVTSGTR